MSRNTMYRLSGLAAMVGSVIGIVIMPLQALAYFAIAHGAESLEPAWVAVARPLLTPLLTFGTPDVVYTIYGKLALLTVLGFLAGLLGLHALQRPRAGRLEKVGFWMSLIGTILLACGVIGAYWVGALNFSFLAFIVPSFLIMLIGPLLFGIGTLRAGIAPRLGAWLLILGSFPGIIGMSTLVGHNASGLFLLALAWIVIGRAFWTQSRSGVKQQPALA